MYKILFAVVVVGKVTPIALKIALKVKACAVPLSAILKINFIPVATVPVGAPIVKAVAKSLTLSCWYSSMLGVKVVAVSVLLLIGFIKVFLFMLFLTKEAEESSIINSS